jgi:hypothetical protein
VTAGPSVPAATGELTRSRPRAEPYSAWFGDNCRWEHAGQPFQLLRSKQQPDGTWLLENTHPGEVHFTLEDGDGRPSRWNTLRALRVLNWYGRSAG